MDTNNQSESVHNTVAVKKREKVEQQLLDQLIESSSKGEPERAESWARAYATFHAAVYPPKIVYDRNWFDADDFERQLSPTKEGVTIEPNDDIGRHFRTVPK